MAGYEGGDTIALNPTGGLGNSTLSPIWQIKPAKLKHPALKALTYHARAKNDLTRDIFKDYDMISGREVIRRILEMLPKMIIGRHTNHGLGWSRPNIAPPSHPELKSDSSLIILFCINYQDEES